MTVATAAATTSPAHTLLDALLASFGDAQRVASDVARPVVILWPDPERQWQSLVPRLREVFPWVYTLGAYDPGTNTGPAIWLRCIVDRSLSDVSPPREAVPVFYLPGVSRHVLRAAAESPPELQPLIELQYRGRVWHQQNGQDWTVEAFFTSRAALGLELGRDTRTREALLRTLSIVADADLSALRGRRLEAEHFDALAVDDPVREMLRWLSDAEGSRRALDDVRWEAFRSHARAAFDFDPERDPPDEAAEHLLQGEKRWEPVWTRFVENPRLYPGIARLLRRVDMQSVELALDLSRRPAANDEAERDLRAGLESIAQLPHHDACSRVQELERQHSARRDLVWTQLGESPLAQMLEPLGRLARLAQTALSGATLESVAEAYAREGAPCDAAAMQSIAGAVRPADETVVFNAVRALYLPWLDAGARSFQQVLEQEYQRRAPHDLVEVVTPESDTCVLFADGLRYDVATTLLAQLETRGFSSRLTHRLAALPTVTPTAKPAVSPVAQSLAGFDGAGDFTPVLRETGQSCNAQRLRDALTREGITVLERDEVRLPAGDAGGWTEAGHIDELGHKLGTGLAMELAREVERLVERIAALLDAGWRRVRVVTDHGWLLMPGGLPKVELPISVAATRWARCAVVSGDSATDMPVWPWHWNAQVRIASPPGAASFIAGYEYAHGGVSPQECVVPDLVIERGIESLQPVIAQVNWSRLRCRVEVNDGGPDLMLDVRTNWKDARTSIVAAQKPLDASGQVSVVVADDEYEGAAAVVVLLDGQGNVVARKVTSVGDSA